MFDFLHMEYASFVYSAFLIFFIVIAICTKNAFNLNKHYLKTIKIILNELEAKK
tara:strand:- start:520 stop:681 length:162 start_codon:yes stop_codon:yes gene_type:complete